MRRALLSSLLCATPLLGACAHDRPACSPATNRQIFEATQEAVRLSLGYDGYSYNRDWRRTDWRGHAVVTYYQIGRTHLAEPVVGDGTKLTITLERCTGKLLRHRLH
jgi:hypothetical protein